MTVASLNLHCGFGRDDEPYDAAAAICQLDAEVICLQEVWQPAAPDAADPVAEAAAKLGARVLRAPMCRRRSVASLGVRSVSGPGELSIAILTTLPVTGYQLIGLGRAPADSVPRVAQVAWLALPGGAVVRVAGTHLTHAGTSLLQLRSLLRTLGAGKSRAAPAATIVAGDLNMPGLLARQAPGYTPAVRGRSYPAGRPRIQLDHILAARGSGQADGRVLPPAGSDHRPVRARLRIS